MACKVICWLLGSLPILELSGEGEGRPPRCSYLLHDLGESLAPRFIHLLLGMTSVSWAWWAFVKREGGGGSSWLLGIVCGRTVCLGLPPTSLHHGAGFPWGPVAWPSPTHPPSPSWQQLPLGGGVEAGLPPGPLAWLPGPGSLGLLLGWEQEAVAALKGGGYPGPGTEGGRRDQGELNGIPL